MDSVYFEGVVRVPLSALTSDPFLTLNKSDEDGVVMSSIRDNLPIIVRITSTTRDAILRSLQWTPLQLRQAQDPPLVGPHEVLVDIPDAALQSAKHVYGSRTCSVSLHCVPGKARHDHMV